MGLAMHAFPPPALPRHSIFAEWSAFNVAGLTAYRLFRAFGAGITPASVVVQVLPVGGNLATNRTDFEELADGQQYSYAAQALSGINDKSGLSIPAIVTAQNDAPVAVADNYDSGDIDIADGLVKGNLFDNDTDADIGPLGKANWTAADVTSTPNVFVPAEIDVPGLSFAGDPGAFTYDPSFGSVTFDYKVDTGTFTDGVNEVPMSPDSNTAMVTITLAYEVTIEDLKSRTNLGSAVSVTFQVRSFWRQHHRRLECGDRHSKCIQWRRALRRWIGCGPHGAALSACGWGHGKQRLASREEIREFQI